MTEKETGNAQPSACVDVLPRDSHRRTGRGGARGAAAPQNFWQLRVFGGARENLGKTSFLRRFRVFKIIILKRKIFSILIKPVVGVIIQYCYIHTRQW